MLALNLNLIRTAQEHVEQVHPPETPELASADYTVVAPVTLSFDVDRDKQHFRLVGTLKTQLTLSCSRCLEPFTTPIDVPFDLRYQPHAAGAADGEREIEEDDLTTAFYEHDEIDLGVLMAEQFYLSLPMKPLCADTCRGLCAECGTNLNRGTCACVTHWDDPRLAVLNALKKES